MTDPAPAAITTERLVLTPLDPADAIEMVHVLADPALYCFTGGEPPTLDALQARYRFQVAGATDPRERWLNWIVRLAESREPVGYVQATVTVTDAEADVAWVIGTAWQGRGIAREAAAAMCEQLRAGGVDVISAHIHPDHEASARVARAIGLDVTDEVDDDGERVWRSGDRP